MVAGVEAYAMSTTPRVREAHIDDASLLHGILVRAFSEYEGRLDPPSGVHSETVASIRDKIGEGGALVCEVGGVVAGCIFYAPKAGYLYVGRLGVLPEYRRHGIGDLLLKAAEGRAAELGLLRVRLGVRIVLGRLRAYYTARGYVTIAFGSHPGYTEPTYVHMEKTLREHGTS
jgi:GNAT superfamily N-acetyltransferase